MKGLLIFLGVALSAQLALANSSNSGTETISGQAVIVGTVTVNGNAFSVGGSTFAITGGKVGVGTSSPNTNLQAVGAAIIGGISSQTLNSGNAFQVGGGTLAVTMNGHVETKGATPTLASCGTSPSIVGNDNAGMITVGSSPGTTCNLTFKNTWTNAPNCVVNDASTQVTITAPTTTTTMNLTASATLGASDKISYICVGYQ